MYEFWPKSDDVNKFDLFSDTGSIDPQESRQNASPLNVRQRDLELVPESVPNTMARVTPSESTFFAHKYKMIREETVIIFYPFTSAEEDNYLYKSFVDLLYIIDITIIIEFFVITGFPCLFTGI